MTYHAAWILAWGLILRLFAPPAEQAVPAPATPLVADTTFAAVFGSLGLLVLRTEPGYEQRTWRIHEPDGSPFAEVDLGADVLVLQGERYVLSEFEQQATPTQQRHGFAPRGFYPDYGIFQFEVRSVHAEGFEVYVDADKTTTKIIPRDDEIWHWQPWETYVKRAFFYVPEETLLVYEAPDAAAVRALSMHDADYRVTEIHQDWVRIVCFPGCQLNACDETRQGWVQWYRDGQAVVDFRDAC